MTKEEFLMKKTKIFAFLSLLLFFLTPLSVQAAESIEINEFTDTDTSTLNHTITPRALITATNIYKWSEADKFRVRADIVTNDGTGKIIDIKNIHLDMYTGEAQEVSLSGGEIWEGGSYATVTVTYRYNGNIYTDIVKYYPYGN